MRSLTMKNSVRGLLVVALVTALAMPLMASEIKINMRTALTGAAINGKQPKGKAEFQMESDLRRFSVEVDNVRLPNGTVLDISVNGSPVGSITLVAQGGTLFLSSAANQSVPNITVGSTVQASLAGTTVLSGKF